MAKTWEKNKKCDPRTQVDTLTARRVLRDCYIAQQEINSYQFDARRRRIFWISAVVLLRCVGHSLSKVDARRSIHLKKSIDNAWRRWKQNPERNIIFFEFIEKERNNILKEYKTSESFVSLVSEYSVVNEPLIKIGARVIGQSEALMEAIEWWELQLEIIEEEARAYHSSRDRKNK